MKLPRDVDGKDLVAGLRRLGYQTVRQDGSHVRLTHSGPPQHHITVPLHNPLRTGMLAALLDQVAVAQRTTRQDLLKRLFGM
jgi:predicted RNA binding protein YcfA (HicA-like mRNA interferase family)